MTDDTKAFQRFCFLIVCSFLDFVPIFVPNRKLLQGITVI